MTTKSEVEVTINAKLPATLLLEFLQTYRTFDEAHFEEVTFMVAVDAPTVKVEQIEEIFRALMPPFTHGVTIKIRRGEA